MEEEIEADRSRDALRSSPSVTVDGKEWNLAKFPHSSSPSLKENAYVGSTFHPLLFLFCSPKKLTPSPPSRSFSLRPSSNPPPTPWPSTSSSTQPPPSEIFSSPTPKEQNLPSPSRTRTETREASSISRTWLDWMGLEWLIRWRTGRRSLDGERRSRLGV